MRSTTIRCHIGSISRFIRRTKRSPIRRSFHVLNCRHCVHNCRPPLPTKNNQSINSTQKPIKVNTFTIRYSIMMLTMHKYSHYLRCMELGEIIQSFVHLIGSEIFKFLVIAVRCREILERKKRQCLVSICLVEQVVRAI